MPCHWVASRPDFGLEVHVFDRAVPQRARGAESHLAPYRSLSISNKQFVGVLKSVEPT